MKVSEGHQRRGHVGYDMEFVLHRRYPNCLEYFTCFCTNKRFLIPTRVKIFNECLSLNKKIFPFKLNYFFLVHKSNVCKGITDRLVELRAPVEGDEFFADPTRRKTPSVSGLFSR